MYTTILPLSLVPAEVPHIPATVVRPFDLASLSHRQVQQLDGTRGRIRVDLESELGKGFAGIWEYRVQDALQR
jgi:hypothetical protein